MTDQTNSTPPETTDADIVFKVWGSRGSIFAGGPERNAFGGDTTCFSIETDGRFLVVDAGSGLRALGQELMAKPGGPPEEIDLLLTHLHIDHICGLPFFAPLLSGRTKVRLWNSVYPDPESLRGALSRGLAPPIFPVDTTLWDSLEIRVPEAGARVALGPDSQARAFPLNHPDGACGWRVNSAGRVVVIASDHEHGNPSIDAQVAYYARFADLVVWDASYTEEELKTRRGWGHSTWQQGLAMGKKVGANRMLMTHHLPERTDAELATMERAAMAVAHKTVFAREGTVISL